MRPLVIRAVDRTTCLRWEAALRVGRPVVWRGPVPDGWHAGELGPLVHSTQPHIARFGAPAAAPDGPPVTVVIPTHRWVPRALPVLRVQSGDTRVLVVSNGGGPEVVAGARVWRTTWTGHADTRRRALEQVDTPLVMMMSDDAIPLGRGFVGTMVAALGGADAVVARQVPWPTATPRTRAAIRRWTPTGRRTLPHADHVATLYRTADLRRWATHDVPIAEDLVWTRGRRVVLAEGAPVLHSHPPHVRADFHRRRAEHAVRARVGASLPVPGIRAALGAAPGVVAGAAGVHDALHQLAELAGMALGARAGRLSG